MSDIDNHSYARDSSSWDGIRVSLAEMERRLGELQDQLDPRGRAAGVQGAMLSAPAIDAARGLTGVTAMPFGPPAPELPDAARAGFVPPPFGSDPAARQSAEEILAQARTAAREVLATAEAQVGLVKQQIEQLLAARETLRSSLRAALADCERSLAQLERGERHPPSAPPLVPQPGRDLALGAPAGSDVPLGMLAGSPAAATGPLTVSGIARAPQARSVFEGSVSLRVGPLRDISQVDTLEIALLQVPGAEQVEIKEFAGRDAVAVIRLFQPVPLIEELRRVLPFQFEIAAGAADTLTLVAVEDAETGRLSDSAGVLPQIEVEGV
jgi:hypothetical protein